MVELVHGLLEAPLGVGADVPSAVAAATSGHQGGARRGIGGDGDGDACAAGEIGRAHV